MTTAPCCAKRGIDFVLFMIGKARDIPIPVCTQCWMIRRALSSLSMIFFAFAALIGVGMLLAWLDGEGIIEVWLGLLMVTVMALFYYGSNLHSNLADTFLLRVSAWLRTDDTIELRIKNEDFATASRVNGTVGLASLSSQPQLVIPGADAELAHAYRKTPSEWRKCEIHSDGSATDGFLHRDNFVAVSKSNSVITSSAATNMPT